jgi:hypothetical protein
MLPTLLGRWQTRLLLIFCIGFPVTAFYSVWLADHEPVLGRAPWIKSLGTVAYDIRPVQILCVLLLVGLLFDVIYIGVQKFRWDRDWPFVFQFFASIGEFIIVIALIRLDLLAFVPAWWIKPDDYPYFILHFALVFIPSFVALLGLIQIFMIRWRYNGGEWGRS